jgi:SAM-dependent methyltransferase
MAIRSRRGATIELALTSFVVLFQELTLIRWMSSEVRVLAYFPNIVLISAFLGLGIGTMRAGRKPMMWLWPVSLATLVAAVAIMHRIAFTSRTATEWLWLLYYDLTNPPVINDVRPPIIIAFVLTPIAFMTLGQIVGERLQDFADEGRSLWGYVADLAGSLLGVIAFAVASFFRTFPVTWFSIFLVVGAFLCLKRGVRLATVYALIAIAILASIRLTEHTTVYSPYYALRARHTRIGSGVEILANGSLHQYAAPLKTGDAAPNEFDRSLQQSYPLPYRFLRHPPRHVLVLGAGSGNDVAVALDRGAERVDAVEIDPVIIEMGRSIHPDRPYLSPKVRVINTDARAYLRNTNEKYDLIIFGTLDSMTRVSALSNVRLDNFVYTVDCMRSARERLTPDGGVALYFMVGAGAIHDKLFAMLTDAFGEPPFVARGFNHLFSEIFLVGPAWRYMQTPQQLALAEAARTASAAVDVPTDDWPYLYLESRSISSFYWSVSLLFLVIAALMIAWLAPEMRRTASRHFDAEMFLFGVAFLLLETKLVTQMSLAWGATWITSAVVFASVLVMILIGTIAMQLRPISYRAAMAGLVISLLVTFMLPTHILLAQNVAARLVLSALFAGSPILFASICFALRFRTRTNANLAFGWNLAGAVAGGLLELLAMAIGLRALSLVALAAYLFAFLVERRQAKLATP